MRIKWILIFGIGLFAAPACAADISASDQGPTASVSAAPAAIDPARLWQHVFEEANPQKVLDTFEVVAKLRSGSGTPDAQKCKDNAPALEEALKVNTAGLSLWYAAYQCATALHDETAAAHRLQVFSEMVRYAIDSRPLDFYETPIRVLSPLDVDAFIAASGQELLYVYYDLPNQGRYLPLTVGLWDAERKRERWLRFDYLDSRVRLMRGNAHSEFPVFRLGTARNFIRMFGGTPGSWAASALEMQEAMTNAELPKRLAAMERSARDGNFNAVMAYTFVCQMISVSDCSTKAVDLLLPWAEKSYALALVNLAIDYDLGLGVKPNQDNARKLIANADRRLGSNDGSLLFVSLSAIQVKRGKALSSLALKTLESLAAQQVPVAEMMLAAYEVARKGNLNADTKTASMLAHAAQAGVPRAQTMYGEYLREKGQSADGIRWIEHAASLGEIMAQRELAIAYEQGKGVEKNIDLARRWNGEAGRGGDLQAMLWMARDYASRPPSAATRLGQAGWLESAMYAGNESAALDLAALYRRGGDGVPGTEKDAERLYRAFAKNNAQARRQLADMLLHSKGIDHDPAEALKLLQMDVDRGDMRSRVALGIHMALGDWGKEQIAEGHTLLEKAAADGDAEAMVEYGFVLSRDNPPRRKEAITYWQQAADKGNRTALNNLAWMYCTSADPTYIDAKRGIELAEKLGNDPGAVGYADTVAACYANAGEFAKAAALEQNVLNKVQETDPADKDFIGSLHERVELYRARKVYREQPAKEAR